MNEDVDDAIVYAVTFINGVNRRLRLLTDPKVKLSVAGILIGTVSNT